MDIRALLSRMARRRPLTAPSLYDVLPHADALPRSPVRLEVVPAEAITGTARHPSNTTTDFLPNGQRSIHWHDDWRRILEAQERLLVLPPIDLVKVGERYFVVDGHKRVAAARRVGAVLDANVTELHVPPALQVRVASFPASCT